MQKSLKYLFNNPYNKKYPLFASLRFIEWKIIKFFKLSNYKKKIWGDKLVYLQHDSFQSMWLMYNWMIDWEEFNLIKKFVAKNDLCIDVGANMGYYTIWFSKFSNNIYSFEPNPVNYNRLKRNIAVNNSFDSAKTFEVALGEKDDTAVLTKNLDIKNHILPFDSVEGGDVVALKRLDSILSENKITDIAYLKIDVEGFEIDVLKGLGDYFINHKVDIIQIEINSAIKNSAYSLNDFLSFIGINNYKLYSYNFILNVMENQVFTTDRENYFLISRIEEINERLKRK